MPAVHNAPSALTEWRKKLSKADPKSISREEWNTIYENLLSDHPISARQDHLSLFLVTLKQLRRALDTSSNTIELSDDFHQSLAPAFTPGARPLSIADALLGSLDSPNKSEQSKAIEVLSAASNLVAGLQAPTSSSSNSSNFLVPLFRHLTKMPLSQRRTIVALSSIVSSIPIGEVPEDIVQRLFKDLDLAEFSPIRCTLIVEILRARWNGYTLDNEPTEEAFQQIVYQPLLPIFDPSTISAQTWQNVQRYLYPALAALSSPDGRGFLAYLESLPSAVKFDGDAMFECWITIASAAVSSKQLGIRSINPERMKQAIWHEDFSIRLKAFAIYTQNEDLLETRSVAGVKACFAYNAALHVVGQRSEFGSALYTFFTHLQQEILIAQRAIQRVAQGHKAIKGVDLPVESDKAPCPRYTIISNPDHALQVALDLRRHIYEEWICPGLAMALRNPVGRVLVSLIAFKLYIDIFGQEEGVQEMVYTKETVDLLLTCQSSEYADVRIKARAILDSATIPLPTYETMASPASRNLLAAALASINHPRKTQAEAGRAILSIFFEKLVVGSGKEVAFVTDLADRLENHLVSAERDLVTAMEQTPLHGLLAVLRDLVRALQFSDNATKEWSPLFDRLLNLIDRVWTVTRPVISLKAAAPVDGKDRPDHEIARAYEVVGDGEGDGDDEDGLDITSLLSGCWRATTGAGELLSAITATPLLSKTAPSGIWVRADVDEGGHRFLTWMHEVRHRGTFTKLATAFASLVQVVKNSPDLRDLCTGWLDHELKTVRDDALSTTRRSAALPYSVLSLITGDRDLSDRGVNALIEMADVKAPTNDITKIHAFNVLQVVLPDAKQGKFLDRYFEKAVMTAIGAFESPNWNVRNVGLILFATLIHRSLNLAKSQDLFEYRTNSAIRQTFIAWHSKYPSILPYLTRYLQENQSTSAVNKHSPLFPILIIIRSLRYSDTGSEVQKPLVVVVESLLGSREWQVRKVAVQALAFLLSPQEALYRATNWTSSIDLAKGNNEIHGRYMLLSQLLDNVIEWPKVDNLAKKQIEQHLLKALDRHGHSTLLDISNTVVWCISAYLGATKPVSSPLRDRTAVVAKEMLFSSITSQRPVQGTQLWSSASFLLEQCPSTEVFHAMLDFGNASPDFQHLPALWALQGLMGPSSLDKYIDTSLFERVIALARSKSHDNAVRIVAMDTLRLVTWDSVILGAIGGDIRRAFIRDMSEVLRGTKYVPLREAALPALAWGIAWSISSKDTDLKCGVLAREVLRLSHEDQPSRESALNALQNLTPLLLSPGIGSGLPNSDLCVLHRALDRLLKDDDEALRNGACEIVRRGLGVSSPICRDRADELWCDWVAGHISTLAPNDAEPWVEWLRSQANVVDTQDEGHDDTLSSSAPLAPIQPGGATLFTVEPSNLFRDPHADAQRAKAILGAIDNYRL